MQYGDKTREQLIQELEALSDQNARMENDLAHWKNIEKENQKLLDDLNERMKEVECFYYILRIVEQSEASMEEMLSEVVELLPLSLRYPDLAHARIIFCKKVYASENFSETKWNESTGIHLNGTNIGCIEVFYSKEIPDMNYGLFLDEEKRLITNIALVLGKVFKRKEAEKKLSVQTHILKERIKELNCLLGISDLLTEPNCSLDKIFYKILNIVPLSWQYPEITCARILFDGEEYTSRNFQMTAWKQAAPILASGEKNGMLEVYYLEEKPLSEEGPFLKEERHLLDALALELGLIIEFKMATKQLFDYQQQLRSLASELSLSEERERRRISAVLHDCIGQNLFVSKVKLDVLKSMVPNINMAETINEISMLMESTIQASRSLTHAITSPALYEMSIREAILSLAGKTLDLDTTRLEMQDGEVTGTVHEDIKVFLFQAVREFLHNIRKHAAAKKVYITLSCDQEKMRIMIEDDGKGLETTQAGKEGTRNQGFGLLSIRERARHLGGMLIIDSAIDKGTRITLCLPLFLPQTGKGRRQVDTRILLVDDHRIVLDSLKFSLEKEPGFKVVAVAESGRIAVMLAEKLQPDVVVMDISMPDLNGIEATSRLVSKNPDIKVIALTINADKQLVSRMLSAGARGYLLKDYNLGELIHAIRTVASNNTYLCPGITNIVTSEYLSFLGSNPQTLASPPMSAVLLTSREHEILQLFAEGNSTKQIAARLHLSINTIDTHKWKIMKKLNIETLAGLVKYAIRTGLTTLDN